MRRKPYIDAAKGVVVLLMLLAHCLPALHGNIAAELARNLINAFHMPFFFILAGSLKSQNAEPFLLFVKRKTKRLLIPFLVANLLFLVLDMFDPEVNVGTGTIVQKLFIAMLNGGQSVSWFLLTLFFVEVLFELTRIMAGKYTICFAVIYGITGVVLGRLGINYPLKIGTVFTALSFYGLSFIFRGRLDYEKKENIIPLWLTFILSAAGMIMISGGTWEMVENDCSDYLLGSLSAFSASLGIVRLLHIVSETPRLKLLYGFFSFVGVHSLYFYLYTGFSATFIMHLLETIISLPFSIKIFIYLIVFFSIYGIVFAIERLKARNAITG